MAEITIEEVRKYLEPSQGREVDINKMRIDFALDKGSKSWDGIRLIMFRLAEQKVVRPSGKRDGIYRVIPKVEPVSVFGTNHDKSIFELMFPKDFDTGMELSLLADNIVVRAGDLILIAGVSNYGKTTLAMNFLAENVDKHKCVIMGNEYVTPDKSPTPRFLNRLETMDWVEWSNDKGDKFTLLPVLGDYAEYVQKDKLNIIDWVNIETGEHYMINTILQEIKRGLGRGVAIVVIQKSETSEAGRGGQFTKDFADVELLIDKHGEFQSRLKIGKVKEYKRYITGKMLAYEISDGVKLKNVREVKKCPTCYGTKWRKQGNSKVPCDNCNQVGYVDK